MRDINLNRVTRIYISHQGDRLWETGRYKWRVTLKTNRTVCDLSGPLFYTTREGATAAARRTLGSLGLPTFDSQTVRAG